MKKKRNWTPVILIAVIIVVIAIIAANLYQLMFGGSVTVQSTDITNAIQQMIPQLVIGAIILVLAIILLVKSVRTTDWNKKKLMSTHGSVALVLALLITATWICMGPQYSNLSTVFSGTTAISEEHLQESQVTAESIAEEGITLLKNKNKALPLASGTKLNVFGWTSTNPMYGGNGSGSSDSSSAVTLLEGLHEAGFELNDTLEQFYTNYRTDRPGISFFGIDYTVPEPSMEEYEQAGIFDNAKAFSDTAMIVIGRSSGEGADLAMNLSDENQWTLDEQGKPITFSSQEDDIDSSRTYLELTHREEQMIQEVASDFNKVIVVINSSQPMELGWLDEYDSIQAAIWCPSPGAYGFRALGKILDGEVNPSGHLVDTFVYDLKATPYFNNFGSFPYTDYADVTGGEENKAEYVNYVEGIYVGYKFYETAAAEGLIDYDSVVQFPFGYGLSYTTFDASIGNVDDDGTNLSLTIDVTNTGDTAGKFVAEIYYNPPYNNGGIEKAAANLVEYAKTELIQPGESTQVSVNFTYEDMASYDDNKIKSTNGAYVLEAGDYAVNLCSDSHTVLDTYTTHVDNDIIYDDEHNGKRSTDQIAATNQFDYASENVTFLSRADHFVNYDEATAAPTATTMTDTMKANYASRTTYDASKYDDSSVTMPTTGANNGLKIQDLAGAAYDDSRWDSLLDQLTVEELKSIAGDGTFHVVATSSINLPYIYETDGPTSVNSFFTGKTGTAFPAPILTAATWSKDLATAFGQAIANELKDYGFTGWYGPGMNIHRTAFSGRNFEYYSEDGFLSGSVASHVVKAARETGIIAYMKHFVLNDSETDRAKGICTFCSEQAMREIYFKPFEMAIKEGSANGIMNSKNCIGTKWVGANPELQQTVVRGEWGFQGVIGTDSLDTASEYYEDPNAAIRCGTDKMMPMAYDSQTYWSDTDSAGTVTALRNAAHNILFALVNSNAMDVDTGAPAWVVRFWTADAIILAALVIWEIVTIRKYGKKKQSAV